MPVLAVLVLLLLAAPAGAAQEPPCVVAFVPDGDTLHCEDGRKVRLLGIDAPERSQKPHGTAAGAMLRRLAPKGMTLRVETDIQRRDRYKRVLAYLRTPDGYLLNEAMVREGYAVPFILAPNVREEARIRRAAKAARAEKRGLWATDAFHCLPADFRRGRCS